MTDHPPTPPLHIKIEHLAACDRLAHILDQAAQDLWKAAALEDVAQMWEEARAAASRVLASCPID